MRNYEMMRHILTIAKKASSELSYMDFKVGAGQDDNILESELVRLKQDGLLDGEVYFDSELGGRSACRVVGLTDEGRDFYNLIESANVWELIHGTLKKAGIDVSYPLLKEVCEEIVKRYVTSCIPDIPQCK